MSHNFDFSEVKNKTGLKKKYVKAAIKVLKWLEHGAEKDGFPGVNENVRLNMYNYIDPDSGAVCLAGAIRIAHKKKFPKTWKSGKELDKHFGVTKRSKLDTLFYGFGINPRKELVAEVLKRFLLTGVADWRAAASKEEYQIGQNES